MFYVTVVSIVGVVLVVAVLVYAYAMYQLARYTRRRILQAREQRRAVEEMCQAQAKRSASDISARSLPDIRLYLRDHRHQLQLEPQPQAHRATARAAPPGEQCSGEELEQVVHQRRPAMRAKSSLSAAWRTPQDVASTVVARSLATAALYRANEHYSQSSSTLSGRSGANTRVNAAELDAGYDSRPGSSSTYSSSSSSSSRVARCFRCSRHHLRVGRGPHQAEWWISECLHLLVLVVLWAIGLSVRSAKPELNGTSSSLPFKSTRSLQCPPNRPRSQLLHPTLRASAGLLSASRVRVEAGHKQEAAVCARTRVLLRFGHLLDFG